MSYKGFRPKKGKPDDQGGGDGDRDDNGSDKNTPAGPSRNLGAWNTRLTTRLASGQNTSETSQSANATASQPGPSSGPSTVQNTVPIRLAPTAPAFVPASNAQAQPTAAPAPTSSVSIPASYSDTKHDEHLTKVGIKRSDAQKSWGSTKMMHEYGLRIEPGKRQDASLNQEANFPREVVTNYVEIIQRPQDVYVYQLTFVRESPGGVERLVKDNGDKNAIFEAVERQGPFFDMRVHKDYVTDYDLIWATKPLFDQTNPQTTPPRIQRSQLTTPVFHSFSRHPVHWEEVRIKWNRRIDARQTPLALLRSANASITDNDDPTILFRGINAFVTQHARENTTSLRCTATAANRFFSTRPNHQVLLDHGRSLRALRGFSVSTRPGEKKLYINIYVGASPFFVEQKVNQVVSDMKAMKKTPRETFNALRGKEVQVAQSPRGAVGPKIIAEVGTPNMFDLQDWSGPSGVDQHCRANYSDLLVNVGVKQIFSSLTRPTDRRNADLMTLHGFPQFRGLMNRLQTTAMLNFACNLPGPNRTLIESHGFPLFQMNQDANQQAATAKYGVSVAKQLLKVPARWLKSPQVHYAPRRNRQRVEGTLDVAAADWNLRDQRFIRATGLDDLNILDLHGLRVWPEGTEPDLSMLEAGLKSALKPLGVVREATRIHTRSPAPNPSLTVAGNEKLSEFHVEVLFNSFVPIRSAPVLVVMVKESYDVYSHIKRVADLRLGQHAVCAVSSKMHRYGYPGDRAGPPYFANIGMKLNLKTAGRNHSVETSHLQTVLDGNSGCQTIIIGADVAHPTGSARPGCPSIAGIVGSVDDHFLHYPASMRLQISRKETIDELADMVKERLIDWALQDGRRGKLPKNMLFYRDGVSESQYSEVRSTEIPQLRDAYLKAHQYLCSVGLNHPLPVFRLTFIVVGKRHNTRFFTDNECLVQKKDSRGNNVGVVNMRRNLVPGSVIDTTITHPYSNDFFLQSHKPLQGTGRSAHYFVLQNQMELSSDDLQRVTHALCYIYARATKGVSYCAPAYYADRLCDRGRAWLRKYLTGEKFENRITKPSYEKDPEFKERVRKLVDQGDYWRPRKGNNPPDPPKYGATRKNPWHPNLDNTMFYL